MLHCLFLSVECSIKINDNKRTEEISRKKTKFKKNILCTEKLSTQNNKTIKHIEDDCQRRKGQ